MGLTWKNNQTRIIIMCRHLYAKIALCLALCLGFTSYALAQPDPGTPLAHFSKSPKSVTLFYPNLGEAREEFTLDKNAAQSRGPEIELLIYLPGAARPETLTMNFTGGRVLSMHSEALRPDEADPVLDPLRAKLDEARSREQTLAAQAAAVDARLNGLNSAFMPEASIAKELEQLDLARQKYVPTLAAEAAEVNRKLEKARVELAWLESELAGHPPSWRVKAVLLREKDSGDAVTYAYILDNCGWSPVYRLEALPDQKTVQFSMSAEVWQRSGFDWSNTDLRLATVQPGLSLAPGELWPWRIGLEQPPVPAMSQKSMSMEMAEASAPMQASADMVMSKPYAAPREVQRASYALWELGAKNLVSNETSSFAILEDKWPAKFSITLRPLTGRQGYLTAEVDKSAATRNLPDGQGLYLVDNTSVGQGAFSPLGEEPIFFGPDPMVFADMKLLDSKSDETGLISKDLTMTWNWRITVQTKRKAGPQAEPSAMRPDTGISRAWPISTRLRPARLAS